MSIDKTETTFEYLILKVPTKDGVVHTILIATSLKTSLFALLDADHQVGTLDIRATYLDGPITSDKFSSGLISRMGGHVDTLNRNVKLTNGGVDVVPACRA